MVAGRQPILVEWKTHPVSFLDAEQNRIEFVGVNHSTGIVRRLYRAMLYIFVNRIRTNVFCWIILAEEQYSLMSIGITTAIIFAVVVPLVLIIVCVIFHLIRVRDKQEQKERWVSYLHNHERNLSFLYQVKNIFASSVSELDCLSNRTNDVTSSPSLESRGCNRNYSWSWISLLDNPRIFLLDFHGWFPSLIFVVGFQAGFSFIKSTTADALTRCLRYATRGIGHVTIRTSGPFSQVKQPQIGFFWILSKSSTIEPGYSLQTTFWTNGAILLSRYGLFPYQTGWRLLSRMLAALSKDH